MDARSLCTSAAWWGTFPPLYGHDVGNHAIWSKYNSLSADPHHINSMDDMSDIKYNQQHIKMMAIFSKSATSRAGG
jgi:hypothetical protein